MALSLNDEREQKHGKQALGSKTILEQFRGFRQRLEAMLGDDYVEPDLEIPDFLRRGGEEGLETTTPASEVTKAKTEDYPLLPDDKGRY